ncbi:hypothetical protein [Streptomyces yaizuensis]|uniref:Uncharacterized protein n=1 Tax=Streptomyces yaizuensis TaxID=2989713 RepID=A0AA86J3T6_9ACTN|nr:hypothetical protein [Streptomyces sp. YSPA8]BDT39567.1 hypothetical protein SYYSPA8_37245 [Streptomyces sp. YSPA8]
MYQVTTGQLITFPHQGNTTTGRVLRVYQWEQFSHVTTWAAVFVPSGPMVVQVAAVDAAPAVSDAARLQQGMGLAGACLMESAWYAELGEPTADLISAVFLDIWDHERATRPAASPYGVALEYDHVLRQVLAEHRRRRGI